MTRPLLGAAALAAILAMPAAAHVTLDPPHAAADGYFKVNVRVPHGCEGSPTLRVRVRIPMGVTGVKPQPKAAWEMTTVKTKLDKPIDAGHGRTVSEYVSEITWTGKLLDEHYEEFGIHMKLPNTPDTVLYFPAVQECEKGVHRWIEIPEAAKKPSDYKEPAPSLKLGPKATGH